MTSSPLVPWLDEEASGGGWIRKMFTVGHKLRQEFGDEAVADLSLGQPLQPGPEIAEAFARAAADNRPGRFGYMPNSGLPELRDRCAHAAGAPGLTGDSITVTCGAAGAICTALHAFVAPGSTVVVQAPYFPEFPLYARTAGCTFVAVPAPADGGLDLGAFEHQLDLHTGAVVLNSPCNPSGHVVSDKEFGAIAAMLNHLPQRPLLLVDEVYYNFHYAPAVRVNPFDHYERTVIARSFSKDIGIAGERIGFLAVHPGMTSVTTRTGIDACMRALGFVNASATAQIAMTNLSSWAIDLAPYDKRRQLVAGGLRNAGIDVSDPVGAIYAWIKSPWPDTLQFVDALTEKRVLLTPGIAFGVPGYVRACFSVPLKSIEAMLSAVAELVPASSAPKEN